VLGLWKEIAGVAGWKLVMGEEGEWVLGMWVEGLGCWLPSCISVHRLVRVFGAS